MRLEYRFLIRHILFATLFLTHYFSSFAQSDKASMSFLDAYEAYFKNDRKTVHLHLNKNRFIVGERIWFSTYVFNHSQNLPSKEDEYIYLDLIDDNAQIVASKTALFKNGIGKGDLLLEENLKTGNYFLQVYTSNMQYFEENESTVYPIEIRNLESGKTSIPQYSTNRDSLKITIAAEGGNLVEGLFSSLAVKTTNLFGYALQPDSLNLVDEINIKLSRIKIDKNGFGTFSLLPKKNKKYALVAHYDGKKIKKNLPLHTPFGYSITVDRNHQKKQFVLTINSKSLQKQELTLIIHKDGNAMNLPLTRNNSHKKAVVLSYDAINLGMNTISLLDEKGKTLAERLLFHRPNLNSTKIELKKTTTDKDSIKIAFQQPKTQINSVFSASILPGSSITSNYSKKAFYSIHLEQYFDLQDWQDLNAVGCENIEELYYLDNVLLLAKSKYKWNTILSSELIVPKTQVLPSTLEGYVNPFKEKNELLQVLLYSKENELLLSTPVDSEKKFAFENIVLAKGSKINLTLSSKNGKPICANFFYSIKPSIESFRYQYLPKKLDLTHTSISESEDSEPSLKKIEQLEEVIVMASKLKYQKFFKSYYGVKVDSDIGMTTLKDFLFQQGYHSMLLNPNYSDPRRAGSAQIGKLSNLCGYIFPTIMIDGRFDSYIDVYADIRMEFIDEIYFNRPTSCSASLVVFTNEKYKNRPLSESEKTSKEFIVDNGYDIPNEFERPEYFNITNDAFERFGILSWSPSIIADEKKPIIIMVPLDNQSSVKIILEGMTTTGELISQDFHVNLNE